MAFNPKAVQHELDLAASELEKAGHADLAEKVDYYADRLVKASTGEVPLIRRALSRIMDEAKRRIQAKEAPAQARNVQKAEHATTSARRVGSARAEVLRRRLLALAAKRKQAAERIDALRNSREERREGRRARLDRTSK